MGDGNRIAALDICRGLLLVASIVLNSLLVVPEWVDHVEWVGLHPADAIFPAFVTLSGVGLAFAHRNGVKVLRLLRRVVVLLLAGLAYNIAVNLVFNDEMGLDYLRWTGVLQVYAVVVLVVAALHLVARSWRQWTFITLGLAAVHTAIIWNYARGCVGGELSEACNPSARFDPMIIPPVHLYNGMTLGYDPEGVVTIIGVLASTAAGAALGHALLEARDTSGHTSAAIPAVGFLVLIFAGVWLASGHLVPMIKKQWTMPFAFVIAAGVGVGLLVVYMAADRRRPLPGLGTLSIPFVALGRNALFVYFGVHLVVTVMSSLPRGEESWTSRISSTIGIAGYDQYTWTALSLVLWIGMCLWLHRRALYIRA